MNELRRVRDLPHFDPNLTLFEDRKFIDAHGVEYVPYIDLNNCIGYVCVDTTRPGADSEFLYFNPSSDDDADPPESNVFVYHGDTGNPANDMPLIHIVVHRRG